MKNLSTKHAGPSISKGKRGFTLMEVVVAMAIFSLLLPPVLLLSLHISRQAINGVEHDASINKARLIQQHFIRMVNASDSFQTKDTGNKLLLKMYDPNTSNWVDNALCFLPQENAFKFYETASDGTLKATKTLSSQAYRHGSNQIFSVVGNLVRLQLRLDEAKQPANENTSTHIDVSISPRNIGRKHIIVTISVIPAAAEHPLLCC